MTALVTWLRGGKEPARAQTLGRALRAHTGGGQHAADMLGVRVILRDLNDDLAMVYLPSDGEGAGPTIVLHDSLRQSRESHLAYGLGIYCMGITDAERPCYVIPLAAETAPASYDPEAAHFAHAFLEAGGPR